MGAFGLIDFCHTGVGAGAITTASSSLLLSSEDSSSSASSTRAEYRVWFGCGAEVGLLYDHDAGGAVGCVGLVLGGDVDGAAGSFQLYSFRN